MDENLAAYKEALQKQSLGFVADELGREVRHLDTLRADVHKGTTKNYISVILGVLTAKVEAT